NGKPEEELTSFRRFMLRNSGNDNQHSLFRDAYMQSLVSHLTVDQQAYRPSIVFINGEYWGVHNLRERIDRHYLASHYGLDEENFTILSGGGWMDEGDPGDEEHYTSMISYISTNDPADPAVYEYVQERIDPENFIDYQAFKIFINNTDWPGNNIRFWRYKTTFDPDASPGGDGRWRWIIFDTDFGFSLYKSAQDNEHSVHHNTLEFATEAAGPGWPNPPWSTLLLRRLLRNEEFRNKFISRFSDQLNSSFKTERMLDLLTEMSSVVEPLVEEHHHRWNRPWGGKAGWQEDIDKMKEYAQLRPAYQVQHLRDYFDLSEPELLTVDVYGNGRVKVNSLLIDENTPGIEDVPYPWSGAYFPEIAVNITAVPDLGYRFTGWNGNVSVNIDTLVTLTEAMELVAYFEPLGGGDEQPEAHILHASDYLFDTWYASEEVASYPASMKFFQSDKVDPELGSNYPHPYILPYNLTSRTRIEGLGEDGIAFINTGTQNDLFVNTDGRDLGSAVLSLNTVDVDEAYVSFLASTMLPNSRVYGIRLQYRIDEESEFQDLHLNGMSVDYQRNTSEGHMVDFKNIPLPLEMLDKEFVQLRWVYYYISGTSGPRAKLRLDNINIHKEAIEEEEEDVNAVSSALEKGGKVYPNPTSGDVNFSLAGNWSGEVSVSVSDTKGKEIYHTVFYKNSYHQVWEPGINFKENGVYIVKWQYGEEQGVSRLVVVR
ncbi:MAG: CotH kinase family protein, partial [Cytophagaceae bacterium]